MIKRIIRKVNSMVLETNIKSYEDFKKVEGFEMLDAKYLEENKEILNHIYNHYVNEVSRPDMAASLELAGFILAICKLKKYKKVLDMGSGLSSYVFRLYASENPGVKVFSVDDDVAWLEKTKLFLEQHQLETDNVYSLDEFIGLKEEGFDCILHDLNFVEVRIQYTTQLLEALKPGGLVIFDDVHKPDYRHALLANLQGTSSKIYSLKPYTLDSYGRFAIAALKG